MDRNKQRYLITFTALSLVMCVYQGCQYLGAYVYTLAEAWINSQEAGGLRRLSRLFYSDWTGVLIQYVFVMGLPFLPVLLLFFWLPKDRKRPRRIPGEDFMTCFVISMGVGYVLNFVGIAVNLVFSVMNGKTVPEMNPVTELMSEMTPGMAIYACLLGPFMEELMFRGILLKRARRLGDRTAVVYCAVMFGLMHGNLTQFLYATAIGLACGFLAVKSNGLRYSVLLHICINSYSVLLVAGQELLSGAGMELAIVLYSAAFLACVFFLIALAVFFLIRYAPRMYRQITLANGPRNPYRRYAYLNPGFVLYALICGAEILAYLL